MEKYKINELIKQVRLDAGVKQKDARKGVMGPAAYSRVENGKKALNFEELMQIIGNLKITFQDFLFMYLEPEMEKTTRNQLVILFNELPDGKALRGIFKMYSDFEIRFSELNIDELSVYFDIKAIFHKNYPNDVAPVTPKEQKLVLERIYNSDKKVLFTDDYRLIAQLINDVSLEDKMRLLKIVFPIARSTFLADKTKQHICNILTNSITPLMAQKKYGEVKHILEIAREHKFLYKESYYYLSHFSYLEYLYEFIVEKKVKSFQKVNDIIKAIDIIGDKESAETMTKELQMLIDDKRNKGFSQHDIIIGRK